MESRGAACLGEVARSGAFVADHRRHTAAVGRRRAHAGSSMAVADHRVAARGSGRCRRDGGETRAGPHGAADLETDLK